LLNYLIIDVSDSVLDILQALKSALKLEEEPIRLETSKAFFMSYYRSNDSARQAVLNDLSKFAVGK
jgi:hypothetical protein